MAANRTGRTRATIQYHTFDAAVGVPVMDQNHAAAPYVSRQRVGEEKQTLLHGRAVDDECAVGALPLLVALPNVRLLESHVHAARPHPAEVPYCTESRVQQLEYSIWVGVFPEFPLEESRERRLLAEGAGQVEVRVVQVLLKQGIVQRAARLAVVSVGLTEEGLVGALLIEPACQPTQQPVGLRVQFQVGFGEGRQRAGCRRLSRRQRCHRA
mmetsp:Transcript_9772/g.28138  ORF Transcript_9772/g.28138 Transcript_9772/m.28138 type:complete len:212 (-) Transcript_9772:32-667(-)